MRRTFTTLIACTAALSFGTSSAAAQTIGFKLGAAFSNMAVDDATTSGITGFSGGGHMRFGLGGRIGVQLELLSVTKGANLTGTGTQNNVDYRFEYVEIPVLVHVPLTAGMAFAPYVFGGAAVGIEVRCRVTPTGTTAGVERDCGDAGTGALNRRSPDLGLVGGGGLAFAMGPGSVIIEGRYTAGMRSINDDAAGRDMRHRTTSIMAGYELPLVRSW
jgi:hypothetical protein